MEFSNRLYQLRKSAGMSQEELAGRLNVSRQTISKWEVGETTPDMEKLIAISDLFDISLDELVKGEAAADGGTGKNEFSENISRTVFTERNKTIAKKAIKVILIFLGVLVAVDILFFIGFFCIYGAEGLNALTG